MPTDSSLPRTASIVDVTAANVGRFRWRICALVFFANTINYVDRQVLGLLAPQLETTFGWSEVQYGYIVTAFQAAFALGYLGFGWFVDRYGTRLAYAVAISVWSLAAIGHGWARSVVQFGVARAFLGLGEGGNTPAAIKTFTEYFPQSERALATGIFNGGSSLGAVLAPLLVPLIALRWGWQAAFFGTGALGFVWLVFWLWLYESPERQRRLSESERRYIQSDPDEIVTARLPWSHLLRYRATWAFVLVKFLTDPIFWFYLYWLPKFLARQHGLDVTGSILPLMTIYGIMAVGSTLGGWASSVLLQRGYSLNRSRKSVMLVAALLIVPILAAALTKNLWLAIGLIGLATAAHQTWSAVLFTTVSDQFPKQAVASVVGIGGTAGAIGGMLIATATGFLLEATGSYVPVFALAATIYLVALGLFQLLVPTLKKLKVEN
ncbi:MAG: MFS transporter [Cytophagaceae bacterium]|nr:MFS transporter [Cytophagaceae bacterium]